MTTLPPICRALAMGINEELKKRKMKTIEERAKESVIDLFDPFDLDEMTPARLGLERRGFVAGAMSERNELLRWRNPQEELPAYGVEVLCKVRHSQRIYEILRHDEFGRWYREEPNGRCVTFWKVIEWRPILEIKQM